MSMKDDQTHFLFSREIECSNEEAPYSWYLRKSSTKSFKNANRRLHRLDGKIQLYKYGSAWYLRRRITLALEHYFYLLSEKDKMTYTSPKQLFRFRTLLDGAMCRGKIKDYYSYSYSYSSGSSLPHPSLPHISQIIRQQLRVFYYIK